MAIQQTADMGKRGVYAGPLYSQLTARLRDRIRHEDWRAGTLIPSESDLAREYGVSVGTARKALEGLESDGWIVRKQGRGTYVNDLARKQMERLCRLRSRTDLNAGLDGSVVSLLSCELRMAHKSESRLWDGRPPMSADWQVIEMIRLYFRNADTSVLETAVFPAQLFPGLETVKKTPLNLFSLLVDDYSIVPHRAEETISATAANEGTAKAMKIPSGAPLLTCESLVWDVEENRVALIKREAHAKGMRYHIDLS